MKSFFPAEDREFILASGSAVRQKMLRNAGLKFMVHSADIDERTVQKDMEEQKKSLSEIAIKLSEQKALSVAQNYPDEYVIGSDQLLVFEDQILNKSANLDQAKEKISKLSGKVHHLISGAAIVKNNEVIWTAFDQADLYMHDLSSADIDAYFEMAGEDVLSSVGAYKLEERGPWLFNKIEGDFFTILGFPLLAFLNFLQSQDLT